MRHGDQTAVRALGFLAVTAAFTLLYRLNHRVQDRRLLRRDAYKKLRESGEFFFAALSH
ncbi:MAG: hypothetical protein ACM31F_07140 [Gemmatimonas sp.]